MSPLFFVVRLKIDAISIEVVKAMYELYELFGQRIPLVEEWQSYESGVFELPQGGGQVSPERIVEQIQPWLGEYPWITADLGGYQMGEWHIVNGAILSKVSFPDHIRPDRYYNRKSLEEYREQLLYLVAEVDAQLAKTDAVSEPRSDEESIPSLPVKSDTEMVEKMGYYAYIFEEVFRRHQVLTYESYREVEEDYEEIDQFVRHAVEQGCEDIETYYHCTEDFLSEWEDKVAEMSEVIEEVEELHQEIEAFNSKHRKPIVSPKTIEHTLQSVSIPEQWIKVVALLRSDSEDTVNQGVQLLSGLGQVDTVSKLLVKDVTGRYNLPIRSQYLASAVLTEIVQGRAPYLQELLSQGLLNPVLIQAAAHSDWDKIPNKYQSLIKEELGRVHLLPGGEFWMGAYDPMITWDAKEMPAHKVRITKPFWCSVYPWSQVLHEELTGTNPSTFVHPTRPVEMISMYEAMHICNLRSIRDGLDPAYELEAYTPSDTYDRYVPQFDWLETNGWRLPTEAEWEYAARAYEMFHWAGSDDPSEVFTEQESSYPTGLFKPNAWGLLDMSGNTTAWCWDSYEEETYINRKDYEEECIDPWHRNARGALNRGGHWSHSGLHNCVFQRGAYGASIFSKYSYMGMRMVRNA